MTDDVATALLRRLRFLTWATIALYVIVVTLIGVVYFQQTRTTDALCAMRHNAEDNVTASQAFLRRHPDGVNGISAADIQAGIVRAQRTIDALDVLNCSAES